MKRHEKGQGLVEYSLILVLVPIAIIAILASLDQSTSDFFCRIIGSLETRQLDFGDQEVTMGIDENYLKIDVKPKDTDWLEHVCLWDIKTSASHGTLRNNKDGTFTYWPDVVGSGTDDSFTYEVFFNRAISRAMNGYGRVNIIIGERDELSDSFVSEVSSASLDENSTAPELDDVREQILTLYEAALWQEESISEGIEFNLESVVEGVEALQDYAGDVQNQLFYENLSQFKQAVENGNWDAIPDIFTSLSSYLAEMPLDVHVSMNLEMAPRLIAACEIVSNGTVSPEVIAATLQVVEELDDDYPGKTETLQLLQEAVEVIEARNIFIQAHTSFQLSRINKIIELLELAGKNDLAEQLTLDSEACSE